MALYPFKDFVITMKDGISKALRISGYDVEDDMVKIKSTQKKWKDSFTSPTNALNTTEKWDLIQTGTGHTLTVAGGELSIISGTTINTETIIMSKETFTDPFRALFGFKASQKIANTDLIMEAVSVNKTTGVPDGLHSVAWRVSGSDNTTTTNAVYTTKNGGLADLASTNVSIVNAVTSYSILELELFADEVWYHSRTMDSNGGRGASYVRHQQIPEPNAVFKIRIRVLNRGTAPATPTTYWFQFVNVVDYAELTAEITSGRGNISAGQGMYATVGGTVSISGNPAMVGNVAHDGVASGSPVRIGGRALTANYTATASGDVADLTTTTTGALIVREHCIPEQMFSYTGTTTTTADVAVRVAGGAGIRNYINGFQYQNTNATATEVVIKDGATVIWKGFASANMNLPANISFDQPLRGSSATAVNVACITTGANVIINIQGYIAT